MLRIQHITSAGIELQTCIQLFQEYAQELNEDLCFQSFDSELENPLKKYGSPMGSLLLAYWKHQPVGCVALTDITHTTTSYAPESSISTTLHPSTPLRTMLRICEMKRLYVQPAFRKHKIGEALVAAIVQEAKALNYTIMKLDTLQRLQPAIQLYLKQGFVVTKAYYKNPLPEVVYMEMELR
jgi:GNAT superfamily N-acetyltransferase